MIADIDLSNQRHPVALGAADGELPACKVTSMVLMSPTSSQAAFSCEISDDAHELRVIRTDPDHLATRRIAAGQWNPLEWSDPRRVLVESESAPWQLAVIDVTSRTMQPVVTLAASVDAASLSPDGRWVVFDGPGDSAADRHDVFIASTHGGPRVPLAPGPYDDLLPAWTPDGGAVLFISDRTGSPGVWLQPVSDGQPVGAPQSLAQDLGRVMDIWAATRTGQLIYFRQTGLTRTMTVALDAEGRLIGRPTEIPTRQMGGTMMASWSPDSRRLAYQVTMTGTRSLALGVLDLASGAERIVSVPFRWFGNPRWTDDNRHVAVRATDSRGDGVFLVDVESGDVSLLKLAGLPGADAIEMFNVGHDNDVVVRRPKGFFRVDVTSGRERLLFPYAAATGYFSVSRKDGSVAFHEWAEPAVALKVWSPEGRSASCSDWAQRTGSTTSPGPRMAGQFSLSAFHSIRS